MGDNFKGIGVFLLGIAVGLSLQYLPLPSQFQGFVQQYSAIVIVLLIVVAVILFVKG